MLAFRYNPKTHEFVGSVNAQIDPLETKAQKNTVFLLPANATWVPAPKVEDGHIPVWNGSEWIDTEDHRGETGYVNGQSVTIKELGPLPEGWTTEAPVEEVSRKDQIMSELNTIDFRSIRSSRSIATALAEGNNPNPDDVAFLASLEAQAKSLREELANLK